MKKNGIYLRHLLQSISPFLVILFLFTWSSEASGDLIFIANKSVPEDSVSTKDLKNIFIGKKKKWQDNSTITIAINNTESIHMELLHKYVRRSPAQFRNIWKRMVFTGEGKFPKSFSSSEKVIEFVASKTGAIGYIDADQVNDTVKIIKPEEE